MMAPSCPIQGKRTSTNLDTSPKHFDRIAGLLHLRDTDFCPEKQHATTRCVFLCAIIPWTSPTRLQQHVLDLVQQALEEAHVEPKDIHCIAYTKVRTPLGMIHCASDCIHIPIRARAWADRWSPALSWHAC